MRVIQEKFEKQTRLDSKDCIEDRMPFLVLLWDGHTHSTEKLSNRFQRATYSLLKSSNTL